MSAYREERNAAPPTTCFPQAAHSSLRSRARAVHSLVECSAAAVLQAAYAADLRRGLEARRARRAGGKRRHSADASRPRARQAGFGRHSLDVRPLTRQAVHGRKLS